MLDFRGKEEVIAKGTKKDFVLQGVSKKYRFTL